MNRYSSGNLDKSYSYSHEGMGHFINTAAGHGSEPYYNSYYDDLQGPREPAEFYNTDTGRFKSLSTQVATSPNKYSILRSNVARMHEVKPQAPAAFYNTNTGTKKFLAKEIEDSRVKYAAAFSKTKRSDVTHQATSSPDVMYPTQNYKSVSESLETTPLSYSVMRSRLNRFTRPVDKTMPVDLTYDEAQAATSFSRTVAALPMSYPQMRSEAKRFEDKAGRTKRAVTADAPHLGPGAYDVSNYTRSSGSPGVHGQLSSFRSSVPRFHQLRDPTKCLGSTYQLSHDAKEWSRHGITFPKAEEVRPAYLPRPKTKG
eukprot:jgi/Mesvir1/1457/Mv14442-RA.1